MSTLSGISVCSHSEGKLLRDAKQAVVIIAGNL